MNRIIIKYIGRRSRKITSIRSLGFTTAIFGVCSMFFLTWWLMLTDNAEGSVTLFERIYIDYSFTPIGRIIFAIEYLCYNKK